MVQFYMLSSTPVTEKDGPGRLSLVSRRVGLYALACALLLVCSTNLRAEGRAAERKVPPIYPEAAKALHIGGVVRVDATVNAAGEVVKAEAQGGNKLLSHAAEDAVKKWKFAPGGGSTVEEIDIVFKLDD